MKSLCQIFAAAVLCLGAALPQTSVAHEGDHGHDVDSYSYQIVRGNQIKAWMDAGQPLVILDARTKEYDDSNRLPGAKILPYNAPEADIQKAAPSKESIIVVYCSNSKCPASKFLADRLVEMGYTNVNKYADGLADWIKRGYPVDKAS